jgi:hypothetical protein
LLVFLLAYCLQRFAVDAMNGFGSGPPRGGSKPGESIGGKGYDDMVQKLRSPIDPEAIGLTKEELAERKKQATAPWKVKKADGKSFSIQSSTRAKKILQEGVPEKMTQKRLRELQQKINTAKIIRWTALGAGCISLAWMFYELLLPVSRMHWERREKMRRRHEEIFLPSLRRVAESRGLPDPTAPPAKDE